MGSSAWGTAGTDATPQLGAWDIVDVAGRVVATLPVRAESAAAGRLQWDSRDTRGRRVPAGVYWARLSIDGSVRDLSRKLGVEMPISDTIYRVLYEGVSPRESVTALMMRETKPEM